MQFGGRSGRRCKARGGIIAGDGDDEQRCSAPGVRWLCMGLPFALDHINLWLVQDDVGWTVIDCGIANDATRAAWEQITHQLGFALDEALAHLHKLWLDGILQRETGADGTLRFQIRR